MIKDITIGQYFPGNSFVHKLDPRAKLIITFAAIIEIFVCKNFLSLAVIVLFTAVAVIVSRISLKVMLKGLKMIYFLIVLMSALQIFYNEDGDILVEWWKIKITTGGVYTAIFMAVRIITLIFISSLLTYTTSPTALTDGIERILSPLKFIKVPVDTLAMMMSIALRFIPTLIDEIDKIMSAQKARGADLETGGIVKRAKALIPIFIPLFVNSFRRAYELAFAMECRCYNGGNHRTRMKQMKLSWRDWVMFVILAVMLAGIILLNHFFGEII
ncbi:MAG: energy-coupling factor transporter transmembrane protein EcfT [Clostridiales bacterium]|nr:energy-coupling factor transporter transmembrane protein EcfT [Clostridiales bacterium]